MNTFHAISLIVVIAALLSFINVKYTKLPLSISLMLFGFMFSITLMLIGVDNLQFTIDLRTALTKIDFSKFILEYLIAFMLFSGAFHANWGHLKKSKYEIISFASLSVIISTLSIGGLMYFILNQWIIPIPLSVCFMFGAIISPTDPVAVLSILTKAKLPKSLETKIVGESLFNDGVSVVLFISILHFSKFDHVELSFGYIITLLVKEVLGGIVMGFIIGHMGVYLMKKIDHFQTEVLISLAIVGTAYSLCDYFKFSGALAMVVSGLIMSENIYENEISETTREYLQKFWKLMDELLNALLFVLIGLEILVIHIESHYVAIGLLCIAITFVGRYISIATPSIIFNFFSKFDPHTFKIMTWGGLRGGVSIALALALPKSMNHDFIVTITYVNVLFSVIFQGLTMKWVIQKLGY